MVKLPEDGGTEAGNADHKHPQDKWGSKPVVYLTPIKKYFERSRSEGDERDSNAVHLQLAVHANCFTFLGKGWWIVDEATGEKKRNQSNRDIDEEHPAPVVIVGNPAAEDGADRGCGHDGD